MRGISSEPAKLVLTSVKQMLNGFTGAEYIYVAPSYTDLHRGIAGLAGIVQNQFWLNHSLFLFCGRRKDRINTLRRGEDGFVFLYKRLENGGSLHTAEHVRCDAYREIPTVPVGYLTQKATDTIRCR